MGNVFLSGRELSFQVPDVSEDHIPALLLGCKPNEYLIVEQPPGDRELRVLEENTPCRISLIDSSGRVLKFDSQIIGATVAPYPILFLAYPTSFESTPPRSAERHPVHIETYFEQHRLEGRLDDCLQGMMHNLSKGGCLMETEQPFLPDELVYMTFSLPEEAVINEDLTIVFEEHPLIQDLEAIIKHSHLNENHFWLGLEFSDTANPTFEKIRRFLEYIELLQDPVKE